MSDRYYGIFHNDDVLYSAYNAALPSLPPLLSAQQQQSKQQQQQQQQQHPQQLGVNASVSAELSNYFAGNTNTVAAGNSFDINNNHALRYFSACGTIGNANHSQQQQQQQQQQQKQIYNNSLLTQHSTVADNEFLASNDALSLQLGANGYSGAVPASYSYSRNRYMPYNRNGGSTTTGLLSPYTSAKSLSMPLLGNTTAMATAAVAAASVDSTNSAGYGALATHQSYSSYQQFAAIYQNYPSAFNSVSVSGGRNCAPYANLSLPVGTSHSDTGINGACDTALKRTTPSKINGRHSIPGSVSSTSGAYLKRNASISITSDIHSALTTENNGNTASSVFESANSSQATASTSSSAPKTDPNQLITLQITNLDYSMEETTLRNFLLSQLKPITPVLSLVFEGNSYAKVTVPDLSFAKQVVSNLHRKKIGHKRMLVSYTRDSSMTEFNTLRCQVAGLLKDVPYYTLPMYKFRELFQSRFKTSISVLDLYKMPDICSISVDNSEDKFISLQASVINSLGNSPLMEGLQHSVPYCTVHFKREQHKGWAEQDIEPLPNVWMTIAEVQNIVYPLLRHHPGDIPVASLVHCITGQLSFDIKPNEQGVNLEHLVCCVHGVQLQVNNFGIKILSWLEADKENSGPPYCGSGSGTVVNLTTPTTISGGSVDRGLYPKNGSADPLYQISREVIELVKMSPKSTMKFNRFIPAYHNHFGKQCRVADYGYTKLIELFEALASVVQIIGDGENRQITLTHRTQLRRFTSDLLRVLRAYGNKSVMLSQLPAIFTQTQNRNFDVTDYGVCDIRDILDGLANSNVVVMSRIHQSDDMLISIPKRKQTNTEMEKTILFAGEMVELFRNAPQYTILFQKFVRSYHYHFAYQCRLSDYGFLKLADLMEAIQGVVEMEQTCDEDKKIFLSPKVARRVFAEQCEDLIGNVTGAAQSCLKLSEVLQLHKKKYGYQILPQTLGTSTIAEAVEQMPYVEVVPKENDEIWIRCHQKDAVFRTQCYRAVTLLLTHETEQNSIDVNTDNNSANANDDGNIKNEDEDGGENKDTSKKLSDPILTIEKFMEHFNEKYPDDNIYETDVKTMKHAIEIFTENNGTRIVRISSFMRFLLNIVRVLEQHKSVLLPELKKMLHCNISTTFIFGYPNLISILLAYSDIFCISGDLPQEYQDISLQPNCQLRVGVPINRQGISALQKFPISKQKTTRRSLPLSEHNNRNYNMNGPPPKTRAICSETVTNGFPLMLSAHNYKNKAPNMGYQAAMKMARSNSQQKPTQSQLQLSSNPHSQVQPLPLSLSPALPLSSQIPMQPQMQQMKFTTLNPKQFTPTPLALHSSFNASNASIYSVASHNSTLNTSSASNSTHGSDLSLNTSLNAHNLSATNSSANMSLAELNLSMTSSNALRQTDLSATATHLASSMPTNSALYAMTTACNTDVTTAVSSVNGKFWDPRRTISTQESSILSDAAPLEPLTEAKLLRMRLQDAAGSEQAAAVTCFPHQQQQVPLLVFSDTMRLHEPVHAMHAYSIFEPPKPDTPPSNHMPFWIDPIWAHNGNNNESTQRESALLNIKLPELKSLNVLPMVLSPYTLSKAENMKRKVFNFENHDRKIA